MGFYVYLCAVCLLGLYYPSDPNVGNKVLSLEFDIVKAYIKHIAYIKTSDKREGYRVYELKHR